MLFYFDTEKLTFVQTPYLVREKANVNFEVLKNQKHAIHFSVWFLTL